MSHALPFTGRIWRTHMRDGQRRIRTLLDHGHPVATTARAFSSAAAASSPLRCRTLAEVGELVQRVYGADMWARMQPPHAAAATAVAAAAAAPGSAGRSARPAVASSIAAASAGQASPYLSPPGSMLHVTSLFRPRPKHCSKRFTAGGLCDDDSSTDAAAATASLSPPLSDRLFTLQVTGAQAPRHALDRFALCLARSLAAEVAYSGKVMREEPELRCTFDDAFAPGLTELRRAHGLPPLPAVSVLTRAALPEDSVGGVPFDHPLLDYADTSDQPITLWHAKPSLREALLRRLRAQGFAVPGELELPTDQLGALTSPSGRGMEIELGALLRAARDANEESSGLSVAPPPAPVHPHKRIRLNCTQGARARAVLEALSSSLSQQASNPRCASPFLAHLSVEAGPQVTRDLYGDIMQQQPQQPSLQPVATLLLSVYRGPIPPEHYRRFLVYPSGHVMDPAIDVAAASSSSSSSIDGSAASTAATAQSLLLSLAPPPTLTLPFLRRYYTVRSEYRCPHDPDWSFYWLERKETPEL